MVFIWKLLRDSSCSSKGFVTFFHLLSNVWLSKSILLAFKTITILHSLVFSYPLPAVLTIPNHLNYCKYMHIYNKCSGYLIHLYNQKRDIFVIMSNISQLSRVILPNFLSIHSSVIYLQIYIYLEIKYYRYYCKIIENST